MKFLTLILIFLFTLSVQTQAQLLTVTDKINSKPILGVQITTPELKIVLTTNAQGQVDIGPLENAISIILQAPGYQNLKLNYLDLKRRQFKVALTESSYALGEVVVSANRFQERREEVPQPVQVLKAADIAFMGQATTAEVLQQSGNILVQKSQLGGGSPIIRGFEANKVLLVVDGVRMNNAIYRGGHLQNVITLDNAVLDRAEVLFGPGSVVYGSDALGGVMHFFTRNPVLATGAGHRVVKTQAYSRYATATQEKTIHADLNIGFKQIGYLSSFTYSDFGDLRQGNRKNKFPEASGKRLFYVQRIAGQDSIIANKEPNNLRPSGYKQFDFLQKIKYQPHINSLHIINIQFSTSSNIPRFDRLTLLRNGQPRFSEWYYGPQKRFFIAYSFESKHKTIFYDHAHLTAGNQYIRESRYDRLFNENFLNNRQEEVKVYSVNADFEKKLKKNEFRYGLESVYNSVQSTAFKTNLDSGIRAPIDTRYPNGGSGVQSVAGYLTHTYKPGPKLILHNGLRYSQVRLKSNFKDKTFFPFPYDEVTQNNGALNGNLGITILPGREWRLAGLASSGFRAPNVDDLSKVFESVPGSLIIPNPDLKPEFTYNTELTVTKVFQERVRLEMTGYYTWYRQAITTQPGTLNGQSFVQYENQLSRVITNVNSQNAYLYGFSGSFTADISPALSFAGNINYTFARLKTDSLDYPLDHIPPLFGQTNIKLKIKKVKSEFFVLFNGRKQLADYNLLGEDNFAFATSTGMPAWYTLNVRTAYQLHPQLQIQAALENLLDRHYRVFASTISAPGRNFNLTLRGNF